MRAFHTCWTRPFFARNPDAAFALDPFELLTAALSALYWRRENGSILLVCDSEAARYFDTCGLSFLWDDGVFPLLDAMPQDINPIAFWAAGKLYALAAMRAPCVMLDTDFIVWQPLSDRLAGLDAAAIHREDISPGIYPDKEAFSRVRGFDLSAFDWTVQPFNTALCYMGNDAFRRRYTDTAISFMRAAPEADDTLTYMVFAEQRLLAMCAARDGARVDALSDLDSLFTGAQQGGFTHTWGFKQQMRDEPALCFDFCRRCADRLRRDFPQAAARIAAVPALAPYFE